MAVVDPTKSTALPKFDHRILDLTGTRFGKLIVIGFAGRSSRDLVMWRCLCDCGNETVASSNSLRNSVERSKKRSCGCLGPEVTRDRSVTHGMTHSITYASWRSMINRCTCPNATGYERWGGRGITVCQQWRDSFQSFVSDMGVRPGKSYSIDRYPDYDGNYEPGNCRWATRKEQANNRRQCTRKFRITLSHNGESLTMHEWAAKLGLSVQTIYGRRWKRLPIEKVLAASRKK